MVDELIDIENMCWSEEKLEVNFIDTDRRAIQNIPLGRYSDDEWGWTQEKNGLFSVRSAYRLLSSLQQAAAASGLGECWNTMRICDFSGTISPLQSFTHRYTGEEHLHCDPHNTHTFTNLTLTTLPLKMGRIYQEVPSCYISFQKTQH